MNWPWSGSIAQRIQWGFYFLIALVMTGMLFSGFNLSRVQSRVVVLEKVARLLDTVLEMRRYEKNWILYGKMEDLVTNQTMTSKAFELLDELQAPGNLTSGPLVSLMQLRTGLADYRELVNREVEFLRDTQHHKLLDTIREKGKSLVTLAEGLDEATRDSINQTLRFVRVSGMALLLIFTVAAMVLGRHLVTSIVRPLRQIVRCTDKIAAGDMQTCADMAGSLNLAEIRAVMQAIRFMLEKLEHREELIIQKEKLAAVGTLVAGVAHELNNPLSNVGTSAEILLEEMRESESVPRLFQLDMLEQITEQTDRARTIVRSLLEFSREREVRPERLLISDILHQTLDLVRGEIPTNVETRLDIKDDALFWADKQRLQQALVNLLLNAFQALGDNGRIDIHGGLDQETGLVKLEISDNGPGIPEAIRKKIFDPFFTTKDVGQGSGLGLAVTREIITKHGGSIEVESREGEGTTFVISLPVEKSDSWESANGKS